jgi:AraC-like DNA-binding protein
MKPHLDFFSFFNLFGALNGLFFAAVFLKIKRGNPRTNLLAALLLANMAMIAAGSFCSYSGYLQIYPKLQKIFSPFLFLMGPLLFFYVRSLLHGDSSRGGGRIFHFFPALLNVIYNVPFYLKSDAEKVAMLVLGITPAVRVIRILAMIHFSIYFLFILREIRRFKTLAKEQYSSLSRLKVRWIAFLGFAFGTILLVNIAPEFSFPIFFDLTKIWEALLIVFLGYKGLTQPVLFLNRDSRVDPEKDGQPLIPESRQKEYVKRITDFMKEGKPYLDPELSLNLFAERLGMPALYCSFIINRHWQKNFFHFVNHYRIEEFKQRLHDRGRHASILETALSAGFNSKSTFNAVFKQYEGITPSQYIKAKTLPESPILNKK